MVACVKRPVVLRWPRLRRWVDRFDHCKSQADWRRVSCRHPRHDADLSTSWALPLVDVPPFLRTEGHLVEKLFVVVAAVLLGSTLQWGSDYLTY